MQILEERFLQVSYSINERWFVVKEKSIHTFSWKIFATFVINTDQQKKVFELGTTTLIFSDEKLNDIMKTIKSLEDSILLIQGVTKTVKNKVKDEIGGFLGMLKIALGASLLGIVLAEKGVLRGSNDVIRP